MIYVETDLVDYEQMEEFGSRTRIWGKNCMTQQYDYRRISLSWNRSISA